jgi:hypothetical protein
MPKIGDRVAAVMEINDEERKVLLFGAGVYVGDVVPENPSSTLAVYCARNQLANPKIQLDDGKIIFGCECWWDDEAVITDIIERFLKKGYALVHVNIDTERENLADESDKPGQVD